MLANVTNRFARYILNVIVLFCVLVLITHATPSKLGVFGSSTGDDDNNWYLSDSDYISTGLILPLNKDVLKFALSDNLNYNDDDVDFSTNNTIVYRFISHNASPITTVNASSDEMIHQFSAKLTLWKYLPYFIREGGGVEDNAVVSAAANTSFMQLISYSNSIVCNQFDANLPGKIGAAVAAVTAAASKYECNIGKLLPQMIPYISDDELDNHYTTNSSVLLLQEKNSSAPTSAFWHYSVGLQFYRSQVNRFRTINIVNVATLENSNSSGGDIVIYEALEFKNSSFHRHQEEEEQHLWNITTKFASRIFPNSQQNNTFSIYYVTSNTTISESVDNQHNNFILKDQRPVALIGVSPLFRRDTVNTTTNASVPIYTNEPELIGDDENNNNATTLYDTIMNFVLSHLDFSQKINLYTATFISITSILTMVLFFCMKRIIRCISNRAKEQRRLNNNYSNVRNEDEDGSMDINLENAYRNTKYDTGNGKEEEEDDNNLIDMPVNSSHKNNRIRGLCCIGWRLKQRNIRMKLIKPSDSSSSNRFIDENGIDILNSVEREEEEESSINSLKDGKTGDDESLVEEDLTVEDEESDTNYVHQQ